MPGRKSSTTSGELKPEPKPSLSPSASLSGESSDRNNLTGNGFAAGASAEYYEPIAEYEGRHRYDPSAQWDEQEEKKLVRKVFSPSDQNEALQ